MQGIFTKLNLIRFVFSNDMAYGNFTDLKRRTASDKFLRDKPFNIAKNPKYDGYEREHTSMVYKFFDKEVVLIWCESCINRLIIRNLKKEQFIPDL